MTGSTRIPNFLIAGAGESGTSWLYACLLQHPEVYMPREMRPEPHYFYKTSEYQKSFSYYLEHYFADVPATAKAIGERSSSYVFGEAVPTRIKRDLPDVKIIFMLRHPVDRAFSNWRFTVQSGLETLSFARAIQLEERRILRGRDPFLREVQPFAYLSRSRYGEQLPRFFEHFRPEQLLILNSDRVKQDERAAFERVCRFLEVDPTVCVTPPGTFPTSSVRSRHLQRLLRWLYGRDFDRAVERTRAASRKPPGSRRLDTLLRANQTDRHPQLRPATRRKLDEYFSESNATLAKLVDWPPSDWYGEQDVA